MYTDTFNPGKKKLSSLSIKLHGNIRVIAYTTMIVGLKTETTLSLIT